MTGQMKRKHVRKDRVLLVNITRLGDMLQATPTIAGMKMENPDCKISVLVEKQFEGICHMLPNIDEVVSLDLSMTVRSLAREQDGIIDAYEYVSEMVEDLRQRNFDYCLNMSSSAYTALLLRLLGVERRGGWSADDEGFRVIESDWARLFATSVFHQNRQYNSLNLVDVFRCSADVEQHPHQLQVKVEPEAKEQVEQMLSEAAFTNAGPLLTLQAGASQGKRQWAPEHFARLVRLLLEKQQARIVMSGTKKELPIIQQIVEQVNSPNVWIAAGRTNLKQLAALLDMSELLVTGDTGPMHMSVAVGTPVVSMFLASAYGYETGPYSAGNIILQPVIGCGPCNPNKPCSRPDCHETITPELMAELVSMRLQEDFTSFPEGIADPAQVTIYRSYFDELGFCDLRPLNSNRFDNCAKHRGAYRKLWLDDLGGYSFPHNGAPSGSGGALGVVPPEQEGIAEVVELARKGESLMEELMKLILDVHSPPKRLGEVNQQASEVDRDVEQLGYHYPHLGPLTRMFLFAKENINGEDALELSRQMKQVYADLVRRGHKFSDYIKSVS